MIDSIIDALSEIADFFIDLWINKIIFRKKNDMEFNENYKK